MRYLGIDLGDKRTGLALGDTEIRLASPVEVVEIPIDRDAGLSLRRALQEACARLLGEGRAATGELVVGLPLNMDGSEGARAKLTRAFGTALADVLGRPVHFHDERLTSVAADWSMAMSGLTHKQKKARRDALAAAAMLQGFLDALPPRETRDPTPSF